MASALRSFASQFAVLAATARQPPARVSQAALMAAYAPPKSTGGRASQLAVLAAYAPPQSQDSRTSQAALLVARSGGEANVTAQVSQAALLIAYGTGVPNSARSDTWTFVLDGHRFWVLPLGPEGDWAYDTVTKQWCKLYTQGFNGLNFAHGVMWKQRIVGGDLLYPQIYEMAAEYPDDEGWRPVMHVVTGGLATRSPNLIGVANFRLTASAGILSDATTDVNLTFSDDNGTTWQGPFAIPVSQGATNQQLLWTALGSFGPPGRIFQISDEGGTLNIYGADAAMNNFEEDNGAGNGG